jgi:hypothetical protein
VESIIIALGLVVPGEEAVLVLEALLHHKADIGEVLEILLLHLVVLQASN